MDPRPLTLRELFAMARARQRSDWDHTAALIATIAGLFSEKPLDPVKFNPYRRPKPRRLTPEERERQNKEGWRLLETGLKSLLGRA